MIFGKSILIIDVYKRQGLVYTLYLTNRPGFGDKGNGICASGYQIYALLLTISSIGVPSAISKLVSERVAVGDNKGAHRIFKIAFATFAIIGLIGSLLLFFGANIIANQWLQIPDAEMTLVASVSYTHLLQAQVCLVDKDIKISYNKVLTKAEAEIKIMYLTEDNRINVVTYKIPVVGFIDIADVSEENICDVNYEIKHIIINPN